MEVTRSVIVSMFACDFDRSIRIFRIAFVALGRVSA